MRKYCTIALIGLALLLAIGCGSAAEPDHANADVTQHMIAEATLASHYIAAARAAGMTDEEINAALARIADTTVISEFWISDENGNVVYTNSSAQGFKFPTDPNAGTQAAPFADLLLGSQTVVVQGFQPREVDGQVYQYVGVAGVDQPRIVQVGMPGPSDR